MNDTLNCAVISPEGTVTEAFITWLEINSLHYESRGGRMLRIERVAAERPHSIWVHGDESLSLVIARSKMNQLI